MPGEVTEMEPNEIAGCLPLKDGRLNVVRTFVWVDGSAGADGAVLEEGELYTSRSKSGAHSTFFLFDARCMELRWSVTVSKMLWWLYALSQRVLREMSLSIGLSFVSMLLNQRC